MTDDQVQKKLNQLTAIANDLVYEAKRRYGAESLLIYEAEGAFHLMDKDADGAAWKRQEGIRFSSKGHCLMDCGAW